MAGTRESRCEAKVPDTLDLAERARLGVNALVGIVDRTHNCQPYQCGIYYRNPPVLSIAAGSHAFINGNEMWGKQVEALAEMRLMSGSEQESGLDERIVTGMVGCIEEDNLFYSYIKTVHGDQLVEGEDFADLVGGARVMLGLLAQYQLDGNPKWEEYVARLARGFQDCAVYKDDHAYYPDGHMGGAISRPRSGWKGSDEPLGTSLYETRDWYECASNVLFSLGGIVQALCQWYRLSGDDKSLALAGKLVKFMLKPRFWRPEAKPRAVISEQHGQFEGHIHATVRGLWGLLEYATVVNDEWLKGFVRDGYEYVRTFGIARIGLLAEGCTVGDMTCLAIKLTDAGVGDYWEDVDQYVRNHLVEIEILDPEPIRHIAAQSQAKPVRSWEDAERFVERNIGALCDDATHPTVATPGSMLCCTYNGLIGYYHAWEAIVRCQDGLAQVNLLLNRASPWLDMDSYLPYEGKVVIRNKTARRVAVRTPRWADKATVRGAVNGLAVANSWLAGYLVFDALRPGDAITIEFPMIERVEKHKLGWEGVKMPGWTEWTLPAGWEPPKAPKEESTVQVSVWEEPSGLTEYTLYIRGNTLVDISPREEALGYPLYRREHYRQAQAPMKKVVRYVSSRIIDL